MTPITVIAGFLGSGKTTLVNRLLVADHDLHIAVLVNDFGDIDIDAKLLSFASPDVLSMKNGCICCSMQADLVAQIRALGEQQEFDHIVIESSGLAEPLNIVRTIQHPLLHGIVRLFGVITLLDASTIEDLSGQARYLAGEQIAAADLVLINKTDLVDEKTIEGIRDFWSCPGLTMINCKNADVPTDLVLSDRDSQAAPVGSDAEANENFEHYVWIPDGCINLSDLRIKLEASPAGVLRTKGFVHSASGKCCLVQAVGRRVNLDQSLVEEKDGLVIIASKGCENISDWLDLLEQSVVGGEH